MLYKRNKKASKSGAKDFKIPEIEPSPGNPVFIIIAIIFIYVFFINAWVCDDAYISFRTADNFTSGYSLCWNIGERVQSFTHPLWLFAVSFFHLFSGEFYFTSIILSFILTSSALYFLLIRISPNMYLSAAAFAMIIFSKPFMDYTTSGLETPLLYLLSSLFLFFAFKKHPGERIFVLTLIFSLLFLSRPDSILIFLPVLIFIIIMNFSKATILMVLAGLLPALIWELFSLFYYGFLFPNTAYAKLGTGISRGEYISQGINYLMNGLVNGPVTIAVFLIVLIILVSFAVKKRYGIVFYCGAGVMLYLTYIVWIGGDFMSGRFLALPFFCSLAVLLKSTKELKIGTKTLIIFTSFFLFFFLGSKNPPVFPYSFNYGKTEETDEENPWSFIPYCDRFGITDERAFYYPDTGLLPVLSNGGRLMHKWAEEGRLTRHSGIEFIVRDDTGFFGFFAGPKVHIVDRMALSNAFLARLPAKSGPGMPEGKWRIGHFFRPLPKGYAQSIILDSNLIDAPKLKALYEKVNLVTSGNIFAEGRMNAIFGFLTGRYDDLVMENYEVSKFPTVRYADSTSAAAYYSRAGLELISVGHHAGAEYILSALDIQPANKWTVINYTMAQDMLGNSQRGIAFADSVIERNKQISDAYIYLSEYFFGRGKEQLSTNMLHKMIYVDPLHPGTYLYLFDYYDNIALDNDSAKYYARKYISKGGSPTPEMQKYLRE